MNEFANRIDTQRLILKSVNTIDWPSEPLLSLTNKSIQRWVNKNKLDHKSNLVYLITNASKKLFFLANKSQEQITMEYSELSKEVSNIHKNIIVEIQQIN